MSQPVRVGPVRCSGLTSGLADVHFDGQRLLLLELGSVVGVLDRYRWVLLGLVITLAISALYVDGAARTTLLVLTGGSLAALLLVLGVEGGLALGTRTSFATARERFAGTTVDLPETDIDLMDNVYGAFRPRLVLHTRQGRLTLSGWWWRRGQLERLQRRLAA